MHKDVCKGIINYRAFVAVIPIQLTVRSQQVVTFPPVRVKSV